MSAGGFRAETEMGSGGRCVLSVAQYMRNQCSAEQPCSSTGGLRVKLKWEKSALSIARMSKLYRLPDHDYPKLRELLMAEMKKKKIEKVRANAVRARSAIVPETPDPRILRIRAALQRQRMRRADSQPLAAPVPGL